MIKGLYFKLNMDKRPDMDIMEFFEKESAYQGITKIELLVRMMSAYFSRTEKTYLLNEGDKQ